MPKIFSETRKQYLYKIIKQNCIDLITDFIGNHLYELL